MIVRKGQTTEVRVRFRRRGGGIATFNTPPRWTLYTPLDETIVTGVAVANGDDWTAQVTVPSTYVPMNVDEPLTLQFTGRDVRGTEYTVDRDLTLNDAAEEWQPDVILYNRLTDDTLTTRFVSRDILSDYNAVFLDPIGNPLATKTETNPTYSATGDGYAYTVDMGTPAVAAYAHPDPYQLIIKTTATNGTVDSQALSAYVLTPGLTKLVTSLRMYLDKTRMRDIDASLEWHLAEYVHFVHEGIKTVNGALPAATFWTTENFPSSLQPQLTAAAALAALRSRHLAEGLNAFQFTGSNTQLDFNRVEVFQTHMDAMQQTVETIPQAKRAAIKTFGHGSPPPGTVSQRLANLGTTAITANLVNRHRIHRSGRMMFR